LLAAFAIAWGASAAADAQTHRSAPEAPDVVQAREAFRAGVRLARESRWAEALAAFQRSAALKPHAVTTFNVGACQRNLGTLTLAHATLERALEQDDEAGGTELPEVLIDNAHAFLEEIDRTLAVVAVHIEPPDAAVAVDGQPLLLRAGSASPPVLVAGVRPLGEGVAAPAADIRVLVDPGTRVFAFSRAGFAPSVQAQTLGPADRAQLRAVLERLGPQAPTGEVRLGDGSHSESRSAAPSR
jgi:hypothetical protein